MGTLYERLKKGAEYALDMSYIMPMYLINGRDIMHYFILKESGIDFTITKDMHKLKEKFHPVLMDWLQKKNLLKQFKDQVKQMDDCIQCGPDGAIFFTMIQIFEQNNLQGLAFIASILLAIHIHKVRGELGIIAKHLKKPFILYTIVRQSDNWDGYDECTKIMHEHLGSSEGSLTDFLYLCLCFLFYVHSLNNYGFERYERFETMYYKHFFNSKLYDNDPAIAINLLSQVSTHIGMLGYQNGFPKAYYFLRLAETLLKRKGKLNHPSYKGANKGFHLLCIFYCGKLLEYTNFTWSCNKKRDKGKALSEIELKQLKVLDFDENFGVELAATGIEMPSQACSNPDEVRKVFNILKNAYTEIKKLGGWKVESLLAGMHSTSKQMANDAIEFATEHFRFLR